MQTVFPLLPGGPTRWDSETSSCLVEACPQVTALGRQGGPRKGKIKAPSFPLSLRRVDGHSRSILAMGGHGRSIDTFPGVWLVTSDAWLIWLGSQANLDVIPAFPLNQPVV